MSLSNIFGLFVGKQIKMSTLNQMVEGPGIRATGVCNTIDEKKCSTIRDLFNIARDSQTEVKILIPRHKLDLGMGPEIVSSKTKNPQNEVIFALDKTKGGKFFLSGCLVKNR